MIFADEGRKDKKIGFTYLMLFKDKNRIDLTLFPVQKLKPDFIYDSLTICWLDKDELFTALPPPTDKDYQIQRPVEKEFLDTCNEFWWVSTYVAKGLLRNEVIYAKEMLETAVRPMFMKVIEWKIGIENDFDISFGKAGRILKTPAPNDFYKQIMLTYANFEIEENWKSLFLMTNLFEQTADFVARKLGFHIHKIEEQNTILYLKECYEEQRNRPEPG